MDMSKRLATLVVDHTTYRYWDMTSVGVERLRALPYSLRLLVENLMRSCAEGKCGWERVEAVLHSHSNDSSGEIPFFPHRVLMQDFTGVPAIADLCALRDAVAEAGGDPALINPGIAVDLAVDHSVQMDWHGRTDALEHNVELEYQRNTERYRLLKWAQGAFSNLRIVPPNSGICHQVNLEHLADVTVDQDGLVHPDSVVGTDSHTTMINGLGVMGWGVGGIEAEAAMLGEPYWMHVPRVVGVRLRGKLNPACTPTDVVLTATQMLRSHGVVESFVEYFGEALSSLGVADRAMIANMSPEYGATMGYFPIDERTIEYLHLTGRHSQAILTEAYAKATMLFYDPEHEPVYDDVLELDLASVEPSIAGPARPQDRIPLKRAAETIKQAIPALHSATVSIDGNTHELTDGAVAIAAITSCTNTSNPTVTLGAALLARNALFKGLRAKAWVKTSFAPGSRVVEDYLSKAGLLTSLEQLGFHIAAYGCGTCIGNSGPLVEGVEQANTAGKVVLAAALSGNRNFEGRIHARVGASFLMSPPLVVAYALAGRMDIDFASEPLGTDTTGKAVYLADIWPDSDEVERLMADHVTASAFSERYRDVFIGDSRWRKLPVAHGTTYAWQTDSTYIARPPFVDHLDKATLGFASIRQARVLLAMGDSVTTDHISPAGSIDPASPAGLYLTQAGVPQEQFNSYGSRRGNHEVMVRGTFANIRIKQALSAPSTGGLTRMERGGKLMAVYDAAMAYQASGIPTIILAGKEYGTGSSRDWAAKGPKLLGVQAVLARSFERIHRSNLVGMGILPLEFTSGQSRESLGLDGYERYDIEIPSDLAPRAVLTVRAVCDDGQEKSFQVRCRIDSDIELAYYRNGGILPYVVRTKLGWN